MVETIAAIAVAKRENRELEERQRVEAEERERQRIEAERRRLLEKKRVALLEQLLCEQAEVDRIGGLLDLLESSTERPPHVEALLVWARERRARQLELLSPKELEQRLSEAKLFEESARHTDSVFEF